jgi:hypothetical protein
MDRGESMDRAAARSYADPQRLGGARATTGRTPPPAYAAAP